jgi:hypothetical protein
LSFLDALLGRDKPVKSNLDRMFGISTAGLTLETEFGLKPTGGAAICFRPVGTGDFARLQSDTEALMQASTKDSPLTWRTFKDSFGYEWIILQAQEFANLVATVHMINLQLQDAGYGEQLLASVFQFQDGSGKNVYWIYNYKRGTFYPFAPIGNQQRDNALELRLNAIMSKELAIEQDISKWYALWGIPLDGKT